MVKKAATVRSRTAGGSNRKSPGTTGNGKSKAGGASKKLVIVESPAKARTIERILGNDYVVKASQGHVRDLPKGKLGVDIEDGFAPSYSVVDDKKAVVQELKALGERAPSIYLATDPDREGEAISWHLVKAAAWDKTKTPLYRVVFHEITEQAVKAAFDDTRSINMELVNAQQARRILDRLVGYQISPLLWRKVQRGTSAGRVQSVALRLVVDREKEIAGFIPKEYWTIEAHLQKSAGGKADKVEPFVAALHSLKGQKGKLSIPDGPVARQIEKDLQGADYSVADVKKRDVKQEPSPPFITSTLQQEAWRKLRFSAMRTMVAAQQLYEGLSIGAEGSIGLITYMRTDSTNVATSALQETREYIQRRFGEDHLPNQPRMFKRKVKGAQEAHEAIRPTSVNREPESLSQYLRPDQRKLYELIWRRMVASQMAAARSDATTVDVQATCKQESKVYMFRATGAVLKFPGFRTLYLESKDDADQEEGNGPLPGLAEGDPLACHGLDTEQHFTQPPPRYTEASLIKALEEKGIGRPSTYAPTISVISDRNYTIKEQGRLKPTHLGSTVSDLLTQFFSNVMDTNFTARMEEELDEVARGERQWGPMLAEFYGPFRSALDEASEAMPRVKVEEATEEICDKCGGAMVIKTGRFGRFLSCSTFPECKNSKPLAAESPSGSSSSEPSQEQPIDEVCEKCGSPMVMKTGRFGRFIACSNYPTCKTTKQVLNKIGVPCPKCGADLVQRRSKGKGRTFYGCSRYPACDFLVNQRPQPEPCPECEGLMVSSGRNGVKCTNCAWKGDAPERELKAAAA